MVNDDRKHDVFFFRMYQCCIEIIIVRDLFFYTFRRIATNPSFYILVKWNTFGISFIHIFFVLLLSVMFGSVPLIQSVVLFVGYFTNRAKATFL